MIAFLIFLGILYFAAAFAIALPYWYELGNSPDDELPRASYALRPVGKLALEGGFSGLQLGAAFVLDPIMRHLEKADHHEDAAGYPPLLLVHGLYHNPSGWMYMRKALRRAGFRKIHTVAYSSWNTSIDAVTALLESSVKALEQQYEGRKPILVGHSLGGLIIRNWLAREENQARAHGVLTLGTPHRGSKMSAVAFGALGRSLIPANPFFEELAQKEKEAAIPCVSLVSEADSMVLPRKNLIPVTRGWAMRVTPYATHAGLLTKASVCRMAAWELHRMAADTPKTRPAPEEKPAETPVTAVMEKPVPTAAKYPAAEEPKPAPARKTPKAANKAAPKKDAGKTRAKRGKAASGTDKTSAGK